MNLNCPICQELFIPASDVSVIPCGHVFHSECVNVWLESYKSKTCPQCRQIVSRKAVIKVYFNFAEVSVNHSDPATLQCKLDSANFQIKLRDKEISNMREKCKKTESSNKELRALVKELEHKANKDLTIIAALKQQIRDLTRQSQEIEGLKAENRTLTHELNLLEDMRKVVTGASSEVSEMLTNYQDTRALAVMVTTLKRELLQQTAKKNKFQKQLISAQNDIRKFHQNLDDESNKIVAINARLEQNEKEKQLLQRKIEELKKIIGEEKLKNCDKNNITSPETRKRIIKSTIKDLNVTKRVLESQTESPSIPEKVRAIQDSDSPYLQIKQSSVGSAIMEMNGSENSNISSKYTIFKKPRLRPDLEDFKPLPDDAFNGLGGHPAIEEFPKRRMTMFRSKSSSKMRRLVRPSVPLKKNQTIDSFLET
ncbi:E3 ubiquitin-protein ligase TRAIP [Chrysoperla carnea]|uniref:E3 ubiquitin-protein ligase TRAIP n=1 Tax=Chrysoperla carnea TaxID=189513 RepID=UPI001D072862|nr:E3 ubiquitin-protein ligase TRAIP [Chrysoperla carnea]